MMQKYRLLFSILFLGLGVGSCNSFNQTEEPIAKAYDKYLYAKDLEGIVPKNTHGNDSLSIVKAFIDQWLHEQVMQHQAEENVNIDDKYIQTQLENYRKSLIRFQ